MKTSFFIEYINKRRLVLFFIFAIGLALRFYRLGANDLWYDEASSFGFAKDFNFFNIINEDFHPPLYYLVLYGCIKLLGTSEFMVRLPSAIFSALTIIVIYRIGKAIFDYRSGLFAALIFALSPFQIWYAQEARPYAMSVFLVGLAVMFLAQIIYEDKIYLWKYFIITGILCVFTEYINLLVLFSFTPIFFFRRNLLKAWLIGWTVIFLPMIYPLWLNIKFFLKDWFWVERPTIWSIVETLKRFGLGYESVLGVSMLVVFSVLVLCVIFKFLKQRSSKLIFVALPFLSILILAFLLSRYLPNSVYLDRQMILVTIFYYLLIAAGISMVNTKMVRFFILCLIILFNALSFGEYYTKTAPNSKKPFKPMAEYVIKNRKEGDVLIFGTKVMSASLGCYYLKDMDSYYFLAGDGYCRRYSRYFNESAERIELDGDINTERIKRIWLFTGSWKRDGKRDYSSERAKAWLSKYGPSVKSEEFNGIFVDLYSI